MPRIIVVDFATAPPLVAVGANWDYSIIDKGLDGDGPQSGAVLCEGSAR